MASEINYESLLSRFDDLVARGIINYAPQKTVQLEDNGFVLEFHISPSLLTKEATGATLKVPEDAHPDHIAQQPACFGPGSDIANGDPDLLITVVHNTHLLVVNKFPVFRPQLLLLTSDSYRRQREPLALEDVAAVCTVLTSLTSPHYVIYNCSREAGASREHKHMQIMPRPLSLFPDNRNFDKQAIPYRYFLRYLHDVDLESPNGHPKLLAIYEELLAEAKRTLGKVCKTHDGGHFPHNVALVKEWIIVIPRRSHIFEGLTANTAGMMGSVWLTEEAQLERWKQVGPRSVLSGVGVPREC